MIVIKKYTMGYSHYWNFPKYIERHPMFVRCILICNNIAKLNDQTMIGNFDSGSIWSNYVEIEGIYETFSFPSPTTLEERSDINFDSCKSRMCYYDKYVTACLCIIGYYLPVSISSDGGDYEWIDGLSIARRYIPHLSLPWYSEAKRKVNEELLNYFDRAEKLLLMESIILVGMLPPNVTNPEIFRPMGNGNVLLDGGGKYREILKDFEELQLNS